MGFFSKMLQRVKKTFCAHQLVVVVLNNRITCSKIKALYVCLMILHLSTYYNINLQGFNPIVRTATVHFKHLSDISSFKE